MRFEKFAEYHLAIGTSHKSRTITTSRLRRIGYRYTHIDNCFGYLQYKEEEKRLIMCKPVEHKADQQTAGLNLNPFNQENAIE